MPEPRATSLPPDEPLPEGEEQAPPGTRAMAIVRWSLVGLMAAAAGAAWIHHAVSSGVLSDHEQRFHCPMHPSVVMERKGECPICGMDLVPVGEAGGAKAAAASGARPAAPGGGDASAAHAPQYTCPMHLAFVTADSKARCPDCGMKLVPREPVATADAAAEGVPGLVEVELTVDRIQLIGMKTATATRAALPAELRTVGFVTAAEGNVVSVNTRFSGWVETLAVNETGQLVEKGQVLATIYSPDLVTAQQVFLNAVKWSDRRPGPAAPSPTAGPQPPTTDLERDARQRVELLGVAPQDLDAIAERGVPMRAVPVRAPVRGYVARKAILRGVYVQPGSELFQLADLSTMWVLADVYESEISRVKVGQSATLSLAAWPGETFEGKVQFLYPALNTSSRTLQARIVLRNPGMKLRPGMYGDVTLVTGTTDTVFVPRDAVVDTGDLQYVFVAKGMGRFAPRRVRTGWSADGKVAVLSGLAPGEKVVTTANFLLDSESRLRAAIDGGGS
jgi:membrane fusion protein, copper/silver efflux system